MRKRGFRSCPKRVRSSKPSGPRIPISLGESGLAIYHRRGDEESMRLNAEAVLCLQSRSPGRYVPVLPLLLGPTMISDRIDRVAAGRWSYPNNIAAAGISR